MREGDCESNGQEGQEGVLLLVDKDGQIQAGEGGAGGLFGREPSTLVGLSLAELLGEECAAWWKEMQGREWRATDPPATWTGRILSPEGSEVQVEIEWKPLVGAASMGGLLQLRFPNPELSKLRRDSQASLPSGLSCSSCCLFVNAPYAVARHRLLYDANDRPSDYLFLEVNPAFERLTGWESSKVIGKTVRDLMGDAAAPWIQRYGEVVASGRHATFQDFAQRLNRWYYVVAYPTGGDEFIVAFDDVTERVQLAHERELLTKRLEHVLDTTPTVITVLERQRDEFVPVWVSPNVEILFGYTPEEALVPEFWIHAIEPEDRERVLRQTEQVFRKGENWMEYRMRTKWGRLVWVQDYSRVTRYENGEPQEVIVSWTDITRRVLDAQELEENLRELRAILTTAQELATSLNPQQVAESIVRLCVEVLGARLAWLGIAEPSGYVRPLAWLPAESKYLQSIRVRHDQQPKVQGATGRAIRSGRVQLTEDVFTDPRFSPWRKQAIEAGFCTSAAFPLTSRGQTFGALNVYSDQAGFFSARRLEVFQTFAHLAAAALQNAFLYETAQERLARLEALHSIDIAMADRVSLATPLEELLKQLRDRLGVDVALLFTYDPERHELLCTAYYGANSPPTQPIVKLGHYFAGTAAAQQRRVVVENVPEALDRFFDANWVRAEKLQWGCAVPLLRGTELLGVMEIFQRRPFQPDPEWFAFLEMLAGQAAIAVDLAKQAHEAEAAAIALRDAYDATIEGWSRAIDLRDHETKGHSQRVADLTVRLAWAVGVEPEQIIHIRRGALLHDVGKLGVPDAILRKPGPLTPEEWEIMRKHPQYAMDMLGEIEFLRPALEIPYCHHEKWDGSGYPRGLKGEEIPLSARLFAVVDVWDALASDRPYRAAWPHDWIVEYIREQSGKHFDPKVVEVFLEMIQKLSLRNHR
ncbi:MAG: GAF domain-containing protein [Candidatus Sumerlaea chitinivorans]|nr:GAF domain-containing protein [Candidatus Sumerlaea chitinivorans]